MKLLSWLAQYNKALVPLTMGVIYFLNAHYGVEIPLGEAEVVLIWTAITSFLTFLIPNKKASDE